ncbi:hypothetical protein EI42_01344 [Thermosporothrix hazakensis]|uniref:Uncharacterized protein n=1 Tax=Thermosporothrix hazakensis TaxID=644383 RepID=A0A326USY1_THEHA|nr:hypothetical protein EI42_01344 [Thermosporothrix hazakensis]
MRGIKRLIRHSSKLRGAEPLCLCVIQEGEQWHLSFVQHRDNPVRGEFARLLIGLHLHRRSELKCLPDLSAALRYIGVLCATASTSAGALERSVARGGSHP